MQYSNSQSLWLRTSSLSICAVFTWTNVLFAQRANPSFWEERRNVVAQFIERRSNNDTATTPDKSGNYNLLAQLPALQTNLPHFEHNQTLSPSLEKGSVYFGKKTSPAKKSLLNPALHHIYPKITQYATIKEAFLPSEANNKHSLAPLVIHIQDIHENYEAQQNISNAINVVAQFTGGEALSSFRIERRLTTPDKSGNYKYTTTNTQSSIVVGLEGAWGPFNLTPYRAFPDKEITADIADYFLKEGLIGGPEHAGLISENDNLQLTGLEDQNLYQNHVKAFKESVLLERQVKAEIEKLQEQLRHQKKQVYPPELLELDSKISAYHKGELGLGEYLTYLSRGNYTTTTPDKSGNYKNIYLFLEALHLEKTINFTKAEEERNTLISHLAKQLSEPEINELISAGTSYRQGHITGSQFYSYLKNLIAISTNEKVQEAKHSRALVQNYPEFSKYVHYAIITDQIKPEDLFHEINTLEDHVFTLLAKGAPSLMELHQISKDLTLVEKLIDHSLTPEEWETYKGRKSDIANLKRRINVVAQFTGGEALSSFRIERRSTTIPSFSKGGLGRIMNNPPQSPFSKGGSSGLATAPDGFGKLTTGESGNYSPFEQFFEYAESRNQSLVENLLTELRVQNSEVREQNSAGSVGLYARKQEYIKNAHKGLHFRIERRSTTPDKSGNYNQPNERYNSITQKRSNAVAVLVAGGFHTPGLTRIMQEQGIPYLVLTPRITKLEGNPTDYLDVFTRDKTPLEKLFTGERLTLKATPQIHSVSPFHDVFTRFLAQLSVSAYLAKYLKNVTPDQRNRIAKATYKQLYSQFRKNVRSILQREGSIENLELNAIEWDETGRTGLWITYTLTLQEKGKTKYIKNRFLVSSAENEKSLHYFAEYKRQTKGTFLATQGKLEKTGFIFEVFAVNPEWFSLNAAFRSAYLLVTKKIPKKVSQAGQWTIHQPGIKQLAQWVARVHENAHEAKAKQLGIVEYNKTIGTFKGLFRFKSPIHKAIKIVLAGPLANLRWGIFLLLTGGIGLLYPQAFSIPPLFSALSIATSIPLLIASFMHIAAALMTGDWEALAQLRPFPLNSFVSVRTPLGPGYAASVFQEEDEDVELQRLLERLDGNFEFGFVRTTWHSDSSRRVFIENLSSLKDKTRSLKTITKLIAMQENVNSEQIAREIRSHNIKKVKSMYFDLVLKARQLKIDEVVKFITSGYNGWQQKQDDLRTMFEEDYEDTNTLKKRLSKNGLNQEQIQRILDSIGHLESEFTKLLSEERFRLNQKFQNQFTGIRKTFSSFESMLDEARKQLAQDNKGVNWELVNFIRAVIMDMYGILIDIPFGKTSLKDGDGKTVIGFTDTEETVSQETLAAIINSLSPILVAIKSIMQSKDLIGLNYNLRRLILAPGGRAHYSPTGDFVFVNVIGPSNDGLDTLYHELGHAVLTDKWGTIPFSINATSLGNFITQYGFDELKEKRHSAEERSETAYKILQLIFSRRRSQWFAMNKASEGDRNTRKKILSNSNFRINLEYEYMFEFPEHDMPPYAITKTELDKFANELDIRGRWTFDEFFAENFKLFFRQPAELKAFDPEIFDFVSLLTGIVPKIEQEKEPPPIYKPSISEELRRVVDLLSFDELVEFINVKRDTGKNEISKKIKPELLETIQNQSVDQLYEIVSVIKHNKDLKNNDDRKTQLVKVIEQQSKDGEEFHRESFALWEDKNTGFPSIKSRAKETIRNLANAETLLSAINNIQIQRKTYAFMFFKDDTLERRIINALKEAFMENYLLHYDDAANRWLLFDTVLEELASEKPPLLAAITPRGAVLAGLAGLGLTALLLLGLVSSWVLIPGIWALFAGLAKVILAVMGWENVRVKTSGLWNALKEPLAEYDQETKRMKEGSLLVDNWYGKWIAGAHENWSHRIVDTVFTSMLRIIAKPIDKTEEIDETTQAKTIHLAWEARTKHLAWTVNLLTSPFLIEPLAHTLDIITIPLSSLAAIFVKAAKIFPYVKYKEGLCVTGDTILPVIPAEILNKSQSQNTNKQIKNLEFKPIVDVKPDDYVLSLNEETGKIEPHRINGLLDMGVKPVFRLTTASGRSIKTTANHPYLVRTDNPPYPSFRKGGNIGLSPFSKGGYRGIIQRSDNREQINENGEWVKVSQLKVGDEIGVPTGEALTSIGPAANFNAFNKNIVAFDVKRSTVFTNAKAVSGWRKVDQRFSTNEWVIQSSVVFQLFVNALLNFSGESFKVALTARRKLYSIHKMDYINPSSRWIFLNGIHPFLLASAIDFFSERTKFGFRGSLDSILSISQPAGFTALLWYSSVDNLSTKASSILESISRKAGVSKRKTCGMPSLSMITAALEPCSNFNTDVGTIFFIGTSLADLSFAGKSLIQPMFTTYKHNLSRLLSVPEAEAAEIPNTLVAQSPNSDILWDRIVSIEPLGLEHVYDIEVEGTHNFIGNGIFAHNTYIDASSRSEKRSLSAVSEPPLGDIISVRYWLVQARHLALLSGEPQAIANAAKIYAQLGYSKQATDLLNESLQIASMMSSERDKSQVLVAIAGVIPQLGDTQQGTDLLNESLQIAMKVSNEVDKSEALAAIAGAYAQLGDTKQATDLLNESLQIARKMSNEVDKSSALVAIADAYAQLGDTQQATDLLNESLPIVRKISNEWLKSRALVAIAGVTPQLGDTQQGTDLLNESLQIARKISNEWHKSQALVAIAGAYAQLGDTQQATDLLNESLQIARKISNEWHKSEALVAIAHVYGSLALQHSETATSESLKFNHGKLFQAIANFSFNTNQEKTDNIARLGTITLLQDSPRLLNPTETWTTLIDVMEALVQSATQHREGWEPHSPLLVELSALIYQTLAAKAPKIDKDEVMGAAIRALILEKGNIPKGFSRLHPKSILTHLFLRYELERWNLSTTLAFHMRQAKKPLPYPELLPLLQLLDQGDTLTNTIIQKFTDWAKDVPQSDVPAYWGALANILTYQARERDALKAMDLMKEVSNILEPEQLLPSGKKKKTIQQKERELSSLLPGKIAEIFHIAKPDQETETEPETKFKSTPKEIRTALYIARNPEFIKEESVVNETLRSYFRSRLEGKTATASTEAFYQTLLTREDYGNWLKNLITSYPDLADFLKSGRIQVPEPMETTVYDVGVSLRQQDIRQNRQDALNHLRELSGYLAAKDQPAVNELNNLIQSLKEAKTDEEIKTIKNAFTRFLNTYTHIRTANPELIVTISAHMENLQTIMASPELQLSQPTDSPVSKKILLYAPDDPIDILHLGWPSLGGSCLDCVTGTYQEYAAGYPLAPLIRVIYAIDPDKDKPLARLSVAFDPDTKLIVAISPIKTSTGYDFTAAFTEYLNRWSEQTGYKPFLSDQFFRKTQIEGYIQTKTSITLYNELLPIYSDLTGIVDAGTEYQSELSGQLNPSPEKALEASGKESAGGTMLWLKDLLYPHLTEREYALKKAWWLENVVSLAFGGIIAGVVSALLMAIIYVAPGLAPSLIKVNTQLFIQALNIATWSFFTIGHTYYFARKVSSAAKRFLGKEIEARAPPVNLKFAVLISAINILTVFFIFGFAPLSIQPIPSLFNSKILTLLLAASLSLGFHFFVNLLSPGAVKGLCVTGDTMLPVIRKAEFSKHNNDSVVAQFTGGEAQEAKRMLSYKYSGKHHFLAEARSHSRPLGLSSFRIEHRLNTPNKLGNYTTTAPDESGNYTTLLPIVEVKPGDYVLSLNEKTGRVEPHRINGLLDMGVKPVFRLTTASGRSIKTTANHPYLVKMAELSNQSSEFRKQMNENGRWVKVSQLKVGDEIGAPVKLSWPDSNSIFLHNKESFSQLRSAKLFKQIKGSFNDFSFGHVFNINNNYTVRVSDVKTQDISEITVKGKQNEAVFKNVTEDFAVGDAIHASIKAGDNLKSLISQCLNHTSTDAKICKNIHKQALSFDECLSRMFHEFAGIFNSSHHVLFGNARIFFRNFFYRTTSANEIKNVAYSNPGTLNAGLTKSNFRINSDPSPWHNFHLLSRLYHALGNLSNLSIIPEVVAAEIPNTLVAQAHNSDILWDRIVSIEPVGYEHVYDIEVEGTHNFIGNGIFAHNTYIYGNNTKNIALRLFFMNAFASLIQKIAFTQKKKSIDEVDTKIQETLGANIKQLTELGFTEQEMTDAINGNLPPNMDFTFDFEKGVEGQRQITLLRDEYREIIQRKLTERRSHAEDPEIVIYAIGLGRYPYEALQTIDTFLTVLQEVAGEKASKSWKVSLIGIDVKDEIVTNAEQVFKNKMEQLEKQGFTNVILEVGQANISRKKQLINLAEKYGEADVILNRHVHYGNDRAANGHLTFDSLKRNKFSRAYALNVYLQIKNIFETLGKPGSLYVIESIFVKQGGRYRYLMIPGTDVKLDGDFAGTGIYKIKNQHAITPFAQFIQDIENTNNELSENKIWETINNYISIKLDLKTANKEQKIEELIKNISQLAHADVTVANKIATLINKFIKSLISRLLQRRSTHIIISAYLLLNHWDMFSAYGLIFGALTFTLQQPSNNVMDLDYRRNLVNAHLGKMESIKIMVVNKDNAEQIKQSFEGWTKPPWKTTFSLPNLNDSDRIFIVAVAKSGEIEGYVSLSRGKAFNVMPGHDIDDDTLFVQIRENAPWNNTKTSGMRKFNGISHLLHAASIKLALKTSQENEHEKKKNKVLVYSLPQGAGVEWQKDTTRFESDLYQYSKRGDYARFNGNFAYTTKKGGLKYLIYHELYILENPASLNEIRALTGLSIEELPDSYLLQILNELIEMQEVETISGKWAIKRNNEKRLVLYENSKPVSLVLPLWTPLLTRLVGRIWAERLTKTRWGASLVIPLLELVGLPGIALFLAPFLGGWAASIAGGLVFTALHLIRAPPQTVRQHSFQFVTRLVASAAINALVLLGAPAILPLIQATHLPLASTLSLTPVSYILAYAAHALYNALMPRRYWLNLGSEIPERTTQKEETLDPFTNILVYSKEKEQLLEHKVKALDKESGFDPRDFEKAKEGMLWEKNWRTYLRAMKERKNLAGRHSFKIFLIASVGALGYLLAAGAVPAIGADFNSSLVNVTYIFPAPLTRLTELVAYGLVAIVATGYFGRRNQERLSGEEIERLANLIRVSIENTTPPLEPDPGSEEFKLLGPYSFDHFRKTIIGRPDISDKELVRIVRLANKRWLDLDSSRWFVINQRYKTIRVTYQWWLKFIPKGITVNPEWQSNPAYEISSAKTTVPYVMWTHTLLRYLNIIFESQNRQLPDLRNKVGLVFGFGNKPEELADIAKHFGLRRAHGVEWVDYLVVHAAKYLAVHNHSPRRFSLHHTNFENLRGKIKDNTIDFIFGNGLFSYTQSPEDMLNKQTAEEMVRVLVPGGIALLNADVTEQFLEHLRLNGEILSGEHHGEPIIFQKRHHIDTVPMPPLQRDLLKTFENTSKQQSYPLEQLVARLQIYGAFDGKQGFTQKLHWNELQGTETMRKLAKLIPYLDKNDLGSAIRLLNTALDETEDDVKSGTIPIIDMGGFAKSDGEEFLEYQIKRINEKEDDDSNKADYVDIIRVIAIDDNQKKAIEKRFRPLVSNKRLKVISQKDALDGDILSFDTAIDKLDVRAKIKGKGFNLALISKRPNQWTISDDLKEIVKILELIGEIKIYSGETEKDVRREWIVRQQA